ncbi:MAG: BsuPI-related putative proteinase inhibitor [Nitrospiria bacterium]
MWGCSFWFPVLVFLALSGWSEEVWPGAGVGLQVSLSTDQAAYRPGDQVRFSLTLTNSGETDIILSFRSSQQADFVILREEKEIWRWSDGRMFAQVLTQIKLRPGERREIQATWDQKGPEGKEPPFGSYEAVGELLPGGGDHRAVASFKIVAPPGSDRSTR